MSYRYLQIFLFGCCFLHVIKAIFPYNITNTNKLLCYSCKGAQCETIANEDDNVIVCNKHAQLCWAGFIDQQPYRTCASRYCTPTGVSLDSDIRIETCCHASLCNSVPLSWAIWNKWYKRSTTHRPETTTHPTTKITTKETTTTKKIHTTPGIFIVNEIGNDRGYLFKPEEPNEEQENIVLSKPKLNASDPASFGITWERIPYNRGCSNRIVASSNDFVLLIPVLLVLLF